MASGPRLAAVRSLAHQLSNGSVTVNESIAERAGVHTLSGVSVLLSDVVFVVVSGNGGSNPAHGLPFSAPGLLLSAEDRPFWTDQLPFWTDQLPVSTGGLLMAAGGLSVSTGGLLMATGGLLMAAGGLLVAAGGLLMAADPSGTPSAATAA